MSKRTTPAKAAAAKRAAFSNQRAQMAQRTGKPLTMSPKKKSFERAEQCQLSSYFGVPMRAPWTVI